MVSSDEWDVITVTYNSAGALERNWKSLAQSKKGVRWIVVDNNSSDNSVEMARQLGAEVIRCESNVGFSAANNIGFRNSKNPYVLFANPDLRIESESLTTLEESLINYPGITSPQLVNIDGTKQLNGRGLPFFSAKLGHRGIPMPGHKLSQYLPQIPSTGVHEVIWLMGAAVATSRTIFEEIGHWNDRYFIYYEDHELGLRVRENGYNVTITSEVTWKHEWARETKHFNLRAWKYELRSALTFYTTYPEYFR